MNQYLWSDIPVLAALSPEIAAEKLAAIGKDDLAQALKQAPQAVSTNRCLEVAIQHQGMAAHVAHVRLYSANDYVYRSPREFMSLQSRPTPSFKRTKIKITLDVLRGSSPVGDCQYLDPNLQAQRHQRHSRPQAAIGG